MSLDFTINEFFYNIFIIFLFFIIENSPIIINSIYSAFMVFGSLFFVYYSKVILNDTNKGVNVENKKLNSAITINIVVLITIVFLTYLVLIELNPTEVLCRFSPCYYGPYAWSIMLLSLGVIILFTSIVYALIRKKINKN